MAVQTVSSLAGQGVIGTWITSPWFTGSQEVTQGWGQTDYGGEPEGHGFTHWHAGADIGLDCGTAITLPHGLSGVAHAVTNPGGYGTGLRITLEQRMTVYPMAQVEVWLGHLRQRMVDDGQVLRGGELVAISNNTGNSTGCHLHFEVRPLGGRYGTDVDPSGWLLDPVGTAGASAGTTIGPTAPGVPGDPIGLLTQGLNNAVKQGVAMAQVGLGSTLMLGGLVVVGFGFRGQNFEQLRASARRTVAGARRYGERRHIAQREGAYESARAFEKGTAEGDREARGLAPRTAGTRPSRRELGEYYLQQQREEGRRRGRASFRREAPLTELRRQQNRPPRTDVFGRARAHAGNMPRPGDLEGQLAAARKARASRQRENRRVPF